MCSVSRTVSFKVVGTETNILHVLKVKFSQICFIYGNNQHKKVISVKKKMMMMENYV